MTVEKPSSPPPRWATSPPANTIVEPSEPEKDEGFQPGSQAQVDTISIDTDTAFHTYQAAINGTASFVVSGGLGAHATASALKDQINTNMAGVVGATESGGLITITAAVPGIAFTTSIAGSSAPSELTLLHPTANRTGKPLRQYVNWFFNWAYQWLVFFVYSTFRWFDAVGLNEMDVTNLGTLPTTGSGLVDNTGGSAISYITAPTGVDFGDQLRRAVGLAEPHAYVDASDNYVYLHYDGSWSYQHVAVGDPAPSVPANSRLQWMVRCAGGNRTVVTDMRQAAVVLGSDRPWRWGNLIANPVAAELKTHTALATLDTQSTPLAVIATGSGYRLVHTIVQKDGRGDLRFYSTTWGFVIAKGCFYDLGTSKWKFDTGALFGSPSNGTIYVFDTAGSFWAQSKAFAGADTTTTWSDSEWDSQGLGLYGVLHHVGSGLLDTIAHALIARLSVPHADSSVSKRTLLFADTAGSVAIRVFLSTSGSSGGVALGPCLEIVLNADWSTDNTHWVQDAAGATTLYAFAAEGVRMQTFTSGSATSFTDAIDNTTNWKLGMQQDAATGRLTDGYNVRGLVVTDGSGGFVRHMGSGVSYSFNGDGGIRVTLGRAMPSDHFRIQTQIEAFASRPDNFLESLYLVPVRYAGVKTFFDLYLMTKNVWLTSGHLLEAQTNVIEDLRTYTTNLGGSAYIEFSFEADAIL